MKQIILKIIILLLLNYGCRANENDYLSIFSEVVQLIESHYFDNEINSQRKKSFFEGYKEQIEKCDDEREFISIINSMLFTFDVSHIGFGKTNDIREKASPYLWAEYTAGIDIRIFEDKVIITEVNTSPGKSNTLPQMGERITAINNKSIAEILDNLVLRPPGNKRNYNFLKTEEVLRYIYGYSKSSINLTTVGVNNVEKNVSVIREKRKNGIVLFDGFPNVYLESKFKTYNESIGYLKFNAFQPSNPADIIDQITNFKMLVNLIIDLRGNNGGSVEAISLISAELLKNNDMFYTLKSRNASTRIDFPISKNAYKGNLIILVDELSISAAEIFSDILQFTKSAVIVGQQTPGNVLSGELFSLQENYSLLLPIQDWIRSDGFRLEGNGVIPDHIVELNQKDLLKGVDTQLDFAINLLRQAN